MSVYLDWNATAPPLDDAIDAVARAARNTWGNPQSIHGHGRAARRVVEDARSAMAELAGADPQRLRSQIEVGRKTLGAIAALGELERSVRASR